MVISSWLQASGGGPNQDHAASAQARAAAQAQRDVGLRAVALRHSAALVAGKGPRRSLWSHVTDIHVVEWIDRTLPVFSPDTFTHKA